MDEAPPVNGAFSVDAQAGPRPVLPPLYRRPVLLDPERHGKLSLKDQGGYDFARAATVLPLNAIEFVAAARSYPIVFAVREDAALPMAVVGLRPNQNLFVGRDGAWEKGFYVPAYARRYPFILMESPDRTKLGLCVDEGSDLLVESDVRPLFREGKPTKLVDSLLEFCLAYHREFEATRQFTGALMTQGLLTANQANLRLMQGERLSVGGFHVVEEAKFNSLPSEIFLDWRSRGWLGLVYCHLISIGSWSNLIDRAPAS